MAINRSWQDRVGPPSGEWVAFHPQIRRNLGRVVAIPAGIAAGAVVGMALTRGYHAASPFPQLLGLLVTAWIWLQACVGPLMFTLLYADKNWVGERGLWKRRGMPANHLIQVHLLHRRALIAGHPSGPDHGISHMGEYLVPARLRWSREQLGAIAAFLHAPTYGIWPNPGGGEPLTHLVSDPIPVAHLRDMDEAPLNGELQSS